MKKWIKGLSVSFIMVFSIFFFVDQANAATKYQFKNNVATLTDIKITITKTKVIKPGKKGNEYGDKPIFAIWYKVKNITGKNIDPTTAWIAVFEATQDTSKNYVNELNVVGNPDAKYYDTQLKRIKKGGTLANAIAYELKNTKTPVKLTAYKGIGGKKLGSKTYKIK